MRYVIVTVTLLLGCALPADAQIYEAVGTRAQGMGGAFVAVADDATAAWWNPAGLATGKLFSLVIDRDQTTQPDKTPVLGPARRDFARGFSLAIPSLALSYYHLRVSEIGPLPFTTAGDLPDRQDPGVQEVHLRARSVNQFGITVGQSIGAHLVFGSTLKVVSAGKSEVDVPVAADLLDRTDDLDVSGDTKTDLDLGAMAQLGGARFGVSLKHLRAPKFGEGIDEFKMDRQARAGASFTADSAGLVSALTFSADVDITRTATVLGDQRHLAAGVEAWLMNRKFAVRSGVTTNTIGPKATTGSVGGSVGGPKRMSFDAALLFGSDESRSGANISLSLTF